MSRLRSISLLLLLMLSPMLAQQPNTTPATMKIDGFAGPPFPVVGVPIFGGTVVPLEILGGANVHFLVAFSPSLSQPGLPFLGELVDLNLSDPSVVSLFLDGFGGDPATFKTNTAGQFQMLFNIPENINPNTTAAFQAVVQDPAAPFGVHLSAGFSIFPHQGLTSLSFNLGCDSFSQVNIFSQFGIMVPFYATCYDKLFVGANGFVTFVSGSMDFTPSNAKMHLQQPRIAMFWSDLNPANPVGGGTIKLTVDQINPANPQLIFRYTNITEFSAGVNGGLGLHTFGSLIDIASGDVEIHEFATNANSNFDILIGMSAGMGLDPTGPGSMDLSATFAGGPFVGQPNEGFYEGFRGVTSVTGTFPVSATYDLANNFWRMIAAGSVATGAFYIMDSIPPVAQ